MDEKTSGADAAAVESAGQVVPTPQLSHVGAKVDPTTPRPYHLVGPDEKYGTWALARVTAGGHSAHNFKTREEAEAKYAEWEAIGRCVECHDVLNDDYMEPYKANIREQQTCMSCLFWAGYARSVGDPTHLVVNGYHYVIKPDGVPDCGSFGHGGALFNIRFNDGREVASRNLWAQGKVPPHFRDRLIDNAEFRERGHKAVGNLQRGGGGYVGPGSADASCAP